VGAKVARSDREQQVQASAFGIPSSVTSQRSTNSHPQRGKQPKKDTVPTAARKRVFSPSNENKRHGKSIPCISLNLHEFCPEFDMIQKERASIDIPVVGVELSDYYH
jgi:hypothetical protein